MTAERPEGLEVDTELVPDLTTELDEAAAAQDSAAAAPADTGGDRPARRYAVYDTRLERYVTGMVTEADAAEHGHSKTGRFRLHEPDLDGRLAPVSRP